MDNKLKADILKKIGGIKDKNTRLFVQACINNNLSAAKKYSLNADIAVCNGDVIKFCVSEGYIDVSRYLLTLGIQP